MEVKEDKDWARRYLLDPLTAPEPSQECGPGSSFISPAIQRQLSLRGREPVSAAAAASAAAFYNLPTPPSSASPTRDGFHASNPFSTPRSFARSPPASPVDEATLRRPDRHQPQQQHHADGEVRRPLIVRGNSATAGVPRFPQQQHEGGGVAAAAGLGRSASVNHHYHHHHHHQRARPPPPRQHLPPPPVQHHPSLDGPTIPPRSPPPPGAARPPSAGGAAPAGVAGGAALGRSASVRSTASSGLRRQNSLTGRYPGDMSHRPLDILRREARIAERGPDYVRGPRRNGGDDDEASVEDGRSSRGSSGGGGSNGSVGDDVPISVPNHSRHHAGGPHRAPSQRQRHHQHQQQHAPTTGNGNGNGSNKALPPVPRPAPDADVIDILDTTSLGGVSYHHSGPYDATLARRNLHPLYSPVEAVRESNLEALRATPREYILDSLHKHVPLQGVATVPPGERPEWSNGGQGGVGAKKTTATATTGDEQTQRKRGGIVQVEGENDGGEVMRYQEGADLMRESDAEGGAYRRWDFLSYHPEDLKGKGEPAFGLDRAGGGGGQTAEERWNATSPRFNRRGVGHKASASADLNKSGADNNNNGSSNPSASKPPSRLASLGFLGRQRSISAGTGASMAAAAAAAQDRQPTTPSSEGSSSAASPAAEEGASSGGTTRGGGGLGRSNTTGKRVVDGLKRRFGSLRRRKVGEE